MTDTFVEQLEAELRAAQKRRIRLVLGAVPAPGGVVVGAVLSVVVVVVIALTALQAHDAKITAGPATASPVPPTASHALALAASAAARGTLAPRLASTQAWYVEADEYAPPRLQPALFGTLVQKWFSKDEERGRQGSSGWQGESAGALGFADWDPALDAPAAQALPTTPSGLRAALGSLRLGPGYLPYNQPNGNVTPDTAHGAFTQLAQLSTLLAEMPLRPATRAAAFRAIAELPGLRYLGEATTEDGRRGIAVGELSPPLRELPQGGPNQPARRYEFELIFNPNSGRVFGFQTRALTAISTLNLSPEGVVYAWSAREVGIAPLLRVNSLLDHERQAGAQLRAPGGPCSTVGAETRRLATDSPACAGARRALQNHLTTSLRSLATAM